MNLLKFIKKGILLNILLLCVNMGVLGQAKTQITVGKKKEYALGDRIEMRIWVTTLPQTCRDGMDQIKLYQSGITISKQSDWKELNRGLWQKDISIVMSGNKKGTGRLTIMRKVDKQSFTVQEEFLFIK